MREEGKSMEQAKESIKRQKKKVFRNFIALMIVSLTLLSSIAIKFNFSYAKIIVNCAIITVLCNHYLYMKIYYLNKELKKLQSKEEKTHVTKIRLL